jgi:hypothetical protein
MDVTLNSLTSPGMVAATLAGAACGGRVVEISKRDIWSPARVAQERPDVAYRLVAIDFLPGQVRTAGCVCSVVAIPCVVLCCNVAPTAEESHWLQWPTMSPTMDVMAMSWKVIICAAR